MKKRKKGKTNVMRLIEKQQIPYYEYSFPWKGARVYAMDKEESSIIPNEVFKTLVTKGNKTGTTIAVIPKDQELNLKVLAAISGNKKMELLPEKELESVTGYIRGGCSPIGMKKNFPTFIEQNALVNEHIIISAGERGRQVGLAPHDLIALTQGTVASLIIEN